MKILEIKGSDQMYITTDILFIITIIAGLFFCYFGNRVLTGLVAVAGFFLFGFIGFFIFSSFTSGYIPIIGALVAGVVGLFLAKPLTYLIVFLLGAFGGLTIGLLVGIAADNLIIAIAFFVIGGILAVIFKKIIVIISTVLIGSTSIMFGIVGFSVKNSLITNLTYPAVFSGIENVSVNNLNDFTSLWKDVWEGLKDIFTQYVEGIQADPSVGNVLVLILILFIAFIVTGLFLQFKSAKKYID
ncbi:MAG: hypothetical protein PWQ77_1780 [Kosmotogales bacterium]|nr:hypothetical protein [Kosmotogales bacterium]